MNFAKYIVGSQRTADLNQLSYIFIYPLMIQYNKSVEYIYIYI